MSSPAGSQLRCLIVDDSAAFRDAAVAMLHKGGITVVGTARDGAEAVLQVGRLHPDVALVDVDLGAESGFEVAERLGQVAVILISTHDEQDFVDLIAASSARGFLPKFAVSPDSIRGLLDA